MPARNVMIAILDQMEALDQQVMAAGTVSQKLSNLLKGGEIELSPLRKAPRALAGSGVSCRPVRPAIQRRFQLHSLLFLLKA